MNKKQQKEVQKEWDLSKVDAEIRKLLPPRIMVVQGLSLMGINDVGNLYRFHLLSPLTGLFKKIAEVITDDEGKIIYPTTSEGMLSSRICQKGNFFLVTGLNTDSYINKIIKREYTGEISITDAELRNVEYLGNDSIVRATLPDNMNYIYDLECKMPLSYGYDTVFTYGGLYDIKEDDLRQALGEVLGIRKGAYIAAIKCSAHPDDKKIDVNQKRIITYTAYGLISSYGELISPMVYYDYKGKIHELKCAPEKIRKLFQEKVNEDAMWYLHDYENSKLEEKDAAMRIQKAFL